MNEIVKKGETEEINKKNMELVLPRLIPYRKVDKWGFCTPEKKILIDCIYQEVKFFSEGYAAVKLNEKWGFINENGIVVIPLHYENVTSFYNELATVVLDGIFYDVDTKNQLMIKPNKLGYQWKFNEAIGLAYEQKIGSVTSIKDASNMSLREADSHSLVYLEKYKSDELDKIETYLIENDDDLITKKHGMNAIRRKGKYGYMDSENRIVIPAVYDDINPFEENLAKVKLNGRFGYINKEGVQYWED